MTRPHIPPATLHRIYNDSPWNSADCYESECVEDMDLHWPALSLGMAAKVGANAADAAPRHSGFAPSPETVSAIRRVSAFASVALVVFCVVYFGLQLLRGAL